MLKIRKPSNSEIRNTTKRTPFLCLLLSCASFITQPIHGMDVDNDWPDQDWNKLFYKPHHGALLGPKILGYLDDRSLRKAGQVNKSWHQLLDQLQHDHLDLEKQQLYSLILDVTGAEANEVQKAHDALENYLQAAPSNRQEERDLCNKLVLLKPRFVQPEFLIRRANESLFNQLLSSNDLQKTHAALTPLVTLIEDLQEFLTLPDLQPLLFPLADHYETYLQKLLLMPLCDRALHLHPKALLSGEGFLGNTQGLTSYRISQEMARSLLSKDEYGLSARTNVQGSHAVSFKRSHANPTHGVHFKGNTTNTGLPVGREAAVHALSQILFPQDTGESRTSVSSLLCLKEVEIKTPIEGTDVNKAFREALRDGKTSEEFFNHFPHYEKEFTQKNPSHIIQAGLHVEGVSLEDFIEGMEQGKYVYDSIDLASFSDHIFLSMLTNPTDGTPSNFMLQKNERKGNEPNETFSVVGIDNDMALEVGDTFVETVQSKFVPGQKITTQQKHSVRVKNILMCLPLMNTPLSPTTVKRILALNPELMALQWCERLQKQNAQYDQLQKGQYVTSNFNLKQENYLSSSQLNDLHLPFLLDPDFISQCSQTIRKAQAYFAGHFALTHWQLLLNIHPLSSRFYQEMLSLANGSVMKAYLKIDPPKSEPGKPRQEIPYLEDVLNLGEKLLTGQTVREALTNVTAPPDGTKAFKQPIIAAAQSILATTDLFQQPFLMPFLRPALEGFGELIQAQSKLHPSWFKDALLHFAISEGSPLPYIKRLLELGLDVTITDKERRTTLRKSLDQGADLSHLSLLKSFCPKDQLVSWVNTISSDRLTALDIALEKRQIPAFKELMTYGASVCHPNIALKFYKNVIQTTTDASLKQSFLKLMNINDDIRWHVCLEEMLPLYNHKVTQQGLPLFTAKSSKRLLPDIIKDQLINNKNEWKSYTQEGNHLVCRATHFNKTLNTEHSLYFKVYPELPGIEEAVGLLTRKLLGYGAPHTELINIGGCPVLISHSHGDKRRTLDFMLRNHPHILKNLDEESLSGLILVAMLINPEDGKPTNYVIEPHPNNPKKYRIVGIDNDHAFVPAIVTEKPKKEFFSQKLVPIAQVKTVLYCLDQMKDPVHPAIRNLFINLRPDEILDEWLRELKKVNASYNDLFLNSQDHVKFFKEHECFLGIPFQKGAISHLYDKLVSLRDLLTKNPQISHLDLLSKLEERLAKRYQAASHLPSVKERWDAVDAVFYEKTKTGSGTTLTRSGDILRSMSIPLEESVLESIRLGKALGPIQALEELNKSKEVLQIKTLEALGARAGDSNILKTLQLQSTRAKFLRDLDFKDLSPQEQEAVLSYLQNKQLASLTLKNCNRVTDSWLAQQLDVSPVKKLDLRGCEQITYKSLVHLSKTALTLEELNLSTIKSLKEIGDLGNIYDDPLVFNALRFLNLSNCTNLTKLLIKAPNLYYLNIENCSLLNDQMLDGVIAGSTNLTKLCLTGADKITGRSLREKYPTWLLTNTTLTDQELTQLKNQNLSKRTFLDYDKTFLYHDYDGKHFDEETLKVYLKAASQGYGKAQSQLGEIYVNGYGVPLDKLEAIKWYQKATDQGDKEAKEKLGELFMRIGREYEASVSKDYIEAIKWYQKAADQGYAEGQYTLGRMYHIGRGAPQDHRKAVEFHQKAADQGYAFAQQELGNIYHLGRGVPKNYVESIKWYRLAADQGLSTSLAMAYLNGHGVPQDYKEAVRLLKIGAEDQIISKTGSKEYRIIGSSFGQFHLGIMYNQGKVVLKDDTEAVKWYKKAANYKHPHFLAQIHLGWAYANGRGVAQNNEKARKWYEKAIKNDTWNPPLYLLQYLNIKIDEKPLQLQALYEKHFNILMKIGENHRTAYQKSQLGELYQFGRGVQKDLHQAFECYRKAVELDDPLGQQKLGRMYKEGIGVQKNINKAVSYIKRFAEQNGSWGMYELALLYRDGEGVERSNNKALFFLKQATTTGYCADASYTLGWMYEHGLGVERDLGQAKTYYDPGAPMYVADAFYSIGRIYEYGLGEETVNCLEAKKWYQKAADVYYEPAVDKLQILEAAIRDDKVQGIGSL